VVSRKMLAALGQPLQIDGREFLVTASIGVALFPRDGGDPAILLKNADVAVYRAKDQGRNSVVFFAEEMNERALRYLTIERDLRRALERSEFTLHYQPIVRADTGKVVGAEALLRWERLPGEFMSPADFIPIAEDSGLIVPIGDWVLATAIAQGRAWRRRSGRRLSMSVNLSARQFRDPALLDTVRDSLAATGFDAADLNLEITESTLMHNPEEAIKTMGALKALGVRLSVDDFGTGYSSLAYLKRLPIDELKIDRSFVREIPGNRDDVAITRAVIELAHNLGLKVVAEGVEDQRQLEFLRAHRCDKIQGYLFSRPVPPAAFSELVARKRMPGVDRPARLKPLSPLRSRRADPSRPKSARNAPVLHRDELAAVPGQDGRQLRLE
jgi:EAL domain-containing protein (putative c-di-GMP-specific phosphodiesterase class I)